MFGTEEASRIIIRELKSVAPVMAAVDGRIYFSPIYAGDKPLPGALVYPQFTQYDGPIDADGTPTFERVDMEVRFIDKGSSANNIRAAAKAALGALAGSQYQETIDGVTWLVSLDAISEVTPPALLDGATVYRQLGTVYSVEFHRGG
jgi:hypothetical protein